MRPISEMSTVQVELCSACVMRCSNCTRMSGTKQKESFISAEQFRAAIDSLVEYSKLPHALVGIMGGEPTLHPAFEEFCDYAASKIDRMKLGLWTTFPPAKRHLREAICRFGNVLLNDHSRDDICHAPILMASEDYFRKACPACDGKGFVRFDGSRDNAFDGSDYAPKRGCEFCGGKGTIADDLELFAATWHCWVQESWSASINTKGAYFCEVAAALADLFDGPDGWKVEPGWWKRTPMEFREQMDWACRKCGAALPIKRTRISQDPTDDVSASNLERLRAIKSRKVARGEFQLHETFEFDPALQERAYPVQTYKEIEHRQTIAAKYGIGLTLNAMGYQEPHLIEDMPQVPATPQGPEPLFKMFQERY